MRMSKMQGEQTMLFEHFIKNRRGSVTIMMTFLLLTVMSLGTTLTEVARYKSLERLYREIESNAAFSLLSHYDRDLLENYGLLGIDSSVGKDEYMYYLQENLNGSLTDSNSIEKLVNVSEGNVDFQKLYDLRDSEVLQSQINEFCAYRVPVNFATELLDLETQLGNLADKLNLVKQILEFSKALTDGASTTVDLYTNHCDYKDASKALKEQADEYERALTYYNMVVYERDEFMDNYYREQQSQVGGAESYTGTTTPAPTDDYEVKLAGYNNNIASAAVALNNVIEQVQSSLEAQYSAYDELNSATDDLFDSGVEMYQSAAEFVDEIKEPATKEKAEEDLGKAIEAYNETRDFSKNLISEVEHAAGYDVKKRIDETLEDLDTLQFVILQDPADAYIVEKVPLVSATYVDMCVNTAENVVSLFADSIKNCFEMLQNMGDLLEGYDSLRKVSVADPHYNNVVYEEYIGQSIDSVTNPNETADVDLKKAMLAQTKEVSEVLDYNPDEEIFDSDADEALNELESAQAEHDTQYKNLLDALAEAKELKWYHAIFPLAKALEVIAKVIPVFLDYMKALISLVNAAIKVFTEDFLRTLISKVYLAKYATTMFSNRSTDLSDDSRLNGSDFNNYSHLTSVESETFDKANVEYIFVGSHSELLNQGGVFSLIFGLRLLCNIPMVFLDTTLNSLSVEAISTTIITIIKIIWVFAEAQADMLVMLSGEEVELVKENGYFEITLDAAKMKDKINELIAAVEEMETRQEEEIEEEKKQAEAQQARKQAQTAGLAKKDKEERKKAIEEAKKAEKEAKKKAKEEKKKAEANGVKKPTVADSMQFAQKIGSFFEVSYEEHLFLFLLLRNKEKTYSRIADLIEMDMRQVKWAEENGDNFNLQDMATYIRVDSVAEYKPVLPIIIPKTELEGPDHTPSEENILRIRNIQYNGY